MLLEVLWTIATVCRQSRETKQEMQEHRELDPSMPILQEQVRQQSAQPDYAPMFEVVGYNGPQTAMTLQTNMLVKEFLAPLYLPFYFTRRN